jgi:hypothetical protein
MKLSLLRHKSFVSYVIILLKIDCNKNNGNIIYTVNLMIRLYEILGLSYGDGKTRAR